MEDIAVVYYIEKIKLLSFALDIVLSGSDKKNNFLKSESRKNRLWDAVIRKPSF